MSKDIKAEIMSITPTQAQEWLDKNTHNRKLNETRVRLFAKAMERGEWYTINQGIGFDKEDNLLDGQNRLAAIIESNKTVKMLVMTGLDKASQIVIDTNTVRSVADLIKLSKGFNVANQHIAIARQMYWGVENRPKSGRKRGSGRINPIADVLVFEKFYTKYHNAVEFAVNAFPKRIPNITTAGCLAAIARAYYHIDKDRLKDFARVLSEGYTSKKSDITAVTLRNWLLTKSNRGKGIGNLTFCVTETAIEAFAANEQFTKLGRGTKTELYPLPGEKNFGVEAEIVLTKAAKSETIKTGIGIQV